MKAITITLRDIKAVKDLINEVDRIKEKSLTFDNYTTNFNGKKGLNEYKEKFIERNINIIANKLKVSYNVVIDMCYDFDFANYVLTDINK
jgi:hypothetical protein